MLMTHLNIPVEVLSEVSGTNLPSIRRAFQLLKILQSLQIMYTTRKGNLMLVGPDSCMLMYMYKQLQKCERTERQIIVFKIRVVLHYAHSPILPPKTISMLPAPIACVGQQVIILLDS